MEVKTAMVHKRSLMTVVKQRKTYRMSLMTVGEWNRSCWESQLMFWHLIQKQPVRMRQWRDTAVMKVGPHIEQEGVDREEEGVDLAGVKVVVGDVHVGLG